MATVNVILDSSEHMCCGERRAVGDTVTIWVQNYKGTIYEERHGEGVGIETQPITGVITAIQWRPAIMLREGEYAMRLVGYESGIPVESTDYADTEKGLPDWAFDFYLETDDPIPPPRTLSDEPARLR
jgi:hypothetical protein